MTPLDEVLAEIEALCAKATAGPWRCRPYNTAEENDSYGDDDSPDGSASHVHVLAGDPEDRDVMDDPQRDDGTFEVMWLPVGSYGGNEIHNLRFAASARSLVPRLVSALKEALSFVDSGKMGVAADTEVLAILRGEKP